MMPPPLTLNSDLVPLAPPRTTDPDALARATGVLTDSKENDR